MVTQSLIIKGRPDQCLRCHGFGHQAQSCPCFTRTEPPTTPSLAWSIAQDSNCQTTNPPGEEGWTKVEGRKKRSKKKRQGKQPQTNTPLEGSRQQQPGKGKEKVSQMPQQKTHPSSSSPLMPSPPPPLRPPIPPPSMPPPTPPPPANVFEEEGPREQYQCHPQ